MGDIPDDIQLNLQALREIEEEISQRENVSITRQRIQEFIDDTTAENTKKNYYPRIELFKSWCRLQNFRDGDTVTGEKLLLFIANEVRSYL
jgi:hypothetical protein